MQVSKSHAARSSSIFASDLFGDLPSTLYCIPVRPWLEHFREQYFASGPPGLNTSVQCRHARALRLATLLRHSGVQKTRCPVASSAGLRYTSVLQVKQAVFGCLPMYEV